LHGSARHSTSCPTATGSTGSSELDSAAFPTDDPEFDAPPAADAKAAAKGVTATAPAMSADGASQIDVMVV
jgi:hypothetical protein